jgi:uncharacterized membrane-anchored protein
MTRRAVFWLLVALQALVPLGLIGWNEVALATGREVTLRTVPVDPIDLFRGRYVTLRYELSSLRPPPGAGRGATVYVPLHRDGGHWTGDVALHDPPAEGPFVRGTVSDRGLVFGIETYYADEDEARRLERRAGELAVRVVLDGDGRARISGIEALASR